MRKLRNYFPNLIICVILVFLILGAEGIILAKEKVFNSATYTKMVEKNNLSDKVINQIETYFNDNYDNTGIPAEVYTEAINKDEIEEYIDKKIIAVFNYINGSSEKIIDVTYHSEQLQQNINDYFTKYANDNNIDVNDDLTVQLKNTITNAESEINTCLDVMMLQYMNDASITSIAKTVYHYMPYVFGILAILIAVCIFIIIALNSRSLLNIFYWIACALYGSSVVSLIPCFILKNIKYFDRLIIRTDYIFSAITGTLYNILNYFILIQIGLFIAAVLLSVIYAFFTRSKKVIKKADA